jgi:hypothetical protein
MSPCTASVKKKPAHGRPEKWFLEDVIPVDPPVKSQTDHLTGKSSGYANTN